MLTNKIAEAAKERKRKEAEIEKKAKEKALLLALLEEKRIQKEKELEEKRYNIEEAKRREEEERIEQLKAGRTKEYYEFNLQGKRVPPAGAPLYFGENVTDSSGIAWYPHGKGEFFYETNLLYEGNFVLGVLHGLAKWNFKDGISWDGEFKMGRIHGVGWLVNNATGDRKEALARDNIILCLKEELIDGKQIEFDDASLKIVSVYGKAKGNIMKNVENWRYLVHMHDELHPRNREIDFSSIKNFKILHHLPQIYDLDRFGIQTAPPKVYNYFEDVYGKGSVKPRLGLALSRKTEEMKYMYKSALHPKERPKTNYSENMFESAAVGLNAAKAEEEEILKKEQRKKQWAALIEARRAEEEEERERKIEEENKKYLEEQVQEQKRKVAAKKASDALYQEGARHAAMEALATFDREQEEKRLQAERVKAMESLSTTDSN